MTISSESQKKNFPSRTTLRREKFFTKGQRISGKEVFRDTKLPPDFDVDIRRLESS